MDTCTKCNAPMAVGFKSGKPYCSAKCWLPKESDPQQPIQSSYTQTPKPMGDKDRQIARAVALKAAIDFNNKVAEVETKDLLALASDFENWLLR